MERDKTYPIFILSLEKDAERRQALLGALGNLGLDFEVMIGIDGRSGLNPRHEAMIDRAAAGARVGRMLSDGEFACALSHRSIQEAVLSRGLEGAVILEDDAIVDERFARFMEQRKYLEADMILLDHGAGRFWPGATQFFDEIRAYRVAIQGSRATGYSISREAARHLVAKATPVAGLADWPCDILPLEPLALYPRVVGRPPDPVDGSNLYHSRTRLQNTREHPGLWRFASAGYWRRWLLKRRSITLP